MKYTVKNNRYVVRSNKYVSETMVDGFEDNDLSEYSNTGGFSTISARSSEGTYCLRADGGSGNKSTISRSGDGLDYYPERGDTIKFDIQFDTLSNPTTPAGTSFMFWFFHGSGSIGDDNYQLEFKTNSGEIVLTKDTGSRFVLDSSSANYNADSWMPVEIDTDSSGMTATFGGATVSSSDTELNSRGIGFFTAGGRGFWDDVRAI